MTIFYLIIDINCKPLLRIAGPFWPPGGGSSEGLSLSLVENWGAG